METIPFDDPRGNGFFSALWQTWREASFSPASFFARIPTANTVGWPLLYTLIFWLVNAVANAIYQPLLSRMLSDMPSRARTPGGVFQTSPEAIVLSFVLAPVLSIGLAFLMAAVLHALLILFGGAQPDFVRTLRTVCYTFGTFAIALVPIAGWFVQPWWWVALLIIGLARAHATETWRSALAVMLPSITCCGLSIAFTIWASAYLLRHMGTPGI